MAISSSKLPDLAIPPGETIAEALESRGMTQAELARQMGRPAQTINEIIRGRKAITPETAIQLEQALGPPAYFWLNLESRYRLIKAKQSSDKKRVS